MVKTDMIKLMTWNRSHYSIFPYGSSIIPVLVSFILLQTPSIALTYDLFTRSLLSNSALPIILIVLQILTVVSMFLCAYTDPGIIPQIVDKYEWDEDMLRIPQKNHLLLEEHKYLMPVTSLGIHSKYCIECCIYRPVRTIHCNICNHCIQTYDHHCPWLGVCVGKFNYKYFVIFIGSVSAISLYIMTVCLIIIIQSALNGSKIHLYVLQIVLGSFSLCFFLPIAKLFCYHLTLIYTRSTTNQELKKIYQLIDYKVPFDRCYTYQRPPMVKNGSKLIFNVEKATQNLTQEDNDQSLGKGKRFSLLLSERRSVLNSLVENQL